MKIAVTGPHCCGKTTVIEKVKKEIEKQFEDIVCFHSFSGANAPVDYSVAQNLKNNTEDELRLTYWMLSMLIGRECNVSDADGKLHVFDRCVFDQAVYTKVLLEEENWKAVNAIVETYTLHFPYDKIFILPINMELLQKYGTKDKSETYAQEVEGAYKDYFAKYGERCFFLPSEQEKQVKCIKEFLLEKSRDLNIESMKNGKE